MDQVWFSFSFFCTFFTYMKKVSLCIMISVRLADCPLMAKTLTLQFSRTIYKINVWLCMMVVLTQFYPFSHFQWPWLYFKVTAVLNRFKLKNMFFSDGSWIYHYFWFSHMFKEYNWHISLFKKTTTFNVGFFLGTIKARSFKLCIITTLLGVYVVIAGVMSLTLFWGCRCFRNINCKFHVLDSRPLQF